MTIELQSVSEALASGRWLGLKEILRALSLPPGQQSALKRVLARMLKEGAVEKDGKQFRMKQSQSQSPQQPFPKKQKFVPQSPQKPAAPKGLVGTLHVHPDGFGFVHPLDGVGDNVYLPKEEARRALDGDRVEVEVGIGHNGRNIGRILRVHQRLRQMVVGTYEVRGTEAWVTPTDGSLGSIKVPKTQIARAGDAVKVRSTSANCSWARRTRLTATGSRGPRNSSAARRYDMRAEIRLASLGLLRC